MIDDSADRAGVVRTDVCIIGGGPAGISVALRLGSRTGISACLVESGGLTFEPAAQELARAETVGAPYYPLHETRIRALGGSTWSWGGICTPLDDMAFEWRAWAADAAWPIERRELDRYEPEALELCGVSPTAHAGATGRARTVIREAGLDPGRVVAVPVSFSRPLRFGVAYQRRLSESVAVRVLLHTTVTGLEVDGGRIVAAVARSRGQAVRIEASAFVLAGGGIENARLLLVAGLGGRAVGRFFMDHPRVVNRFRVRPGRTPLGRLIGGGSAGTIRFARVAVANATQRREEVLNQHANLQFGYAGQRGREWEAARRIAIALRPPWNESPYFQDAGGGRLQLRRADLLRVLARPDRAAAAVVGALSERPSLRRYLEIWSAVEQLPDDRNRVELADDRDPLGVRRARLTWRLGEAEERTYRVGLRIILTELERLEPGISHASMDESDPWPSTVIGNWHHEGTTRMHRDPGRGVVDADCRVHGCANLYVAGSSVFPSSGSTSPTVTIVELGLRLADHLVDELSRGVTLRSGPPRTADGSIGVVSTPRPLDIGSSADPAVTPTTTRAVTRSRDRGARGSASDDGAYQDRAIESG